MNWKSPLQKQPYRKTFKWLLLQLISDVKSCPNIRHQEIGLNSCILCSRNKNLKI